MKLATVLRRAAKTNGIRHANELSRLCDMSYARMRHVWHGEGRTRIEDVALVLYSLGYTLCVKKRVISTDYDVNRDDLLDVYGELISDICPDNGISLTFQTPKRTHHG